MADGCQLEKRKMSITQPLFEISLPYLLRWWPWTAMERILKSLFNYDKIQDGGRPPFWKKENVHNSAAIWDIFSKFGTLMAMDIPQRPRMSLFGYNKIQYGGRPPFWKTENHNNSAAVWAIVTKFGMMVDTESPQCAMTSFRHFWPVTKFKMADGCQFEKKGKCP